MINILNLIVNVFGIASCILFLLLIACAFVVWIYGIKFKLQERYIVIDWKHADVNEVLLQAKKKIECEDYVDNVKHTKQLKNIIAERVNDYANHFKDEKK